MSQMECLLCLELNEEIADCIQINSTNEHNIKNLIEKHLWPVQSLKSKSPWLCVVCWEMLEDFHRFFKRIEDAHLYYECLVQSENESEEDIIITMQTEGLIKSKIEDANEKHHTEEINIEMLDFENPEDSREELEIQDDIEEIEIEDDDLNEYLAEDSDETELVFNENSNDNEEIRTENTEDGKSLVSSDLEKVSRQKERTYNKEIGYEHDKLLAKHYEIACDLCIESFETFPQLMKHFAENHDGTKAYTICCDNKFFSRASLVDHIKSHLDPDYLKCKYCSKILKSRNTLMIHMAWHDGKVYRCKICYKSYLNKSKFEKHKLTHDSNDQPPRFPCAECDKTFSNKSGLKQHQQRIHQHRLLRLCTICGVSLRDHNTFRRHMAKHEGKPSPTSYPCDICGLVLSRKQCVNIHKELKHPDADKPPLECNICHTYKTTCRSKLRDHIRLAHTTERKHKCHICEKTFKERKKLKDHMGVHTGEPVYTCAWCPKTFYSSGNLSSHRMRFHGKEWEEAKRKKEEAKANFIDEQFTESFTSRVV